MLVNLPPLTAGVAGGTNDEALDQWETACGHTLPASYREFIKQWAGSEFERWTSFVRPETGSYDQLARWDYISGPSIGSDEQRRYAKSCGSSAFDNTTMLRHSMVQEAAGLVDSWAPSIVGFATMLGSRRWLAFDFAFDSENPPVVTYDDDWEWQEYPDKVMDFVAPNFEAFVEMLAELESPRSPWPPAPTEASRAWIAHFRHQLGGMTFDAAAAQVAQAALED